MKIKVILVSVLMGLSGVSQAALFDRGGGMIYDDVLNLTWLQDANMGGSMNWNDSVAWADGLSFGGFNDWRLASMDVNGDGLPVNCGGASKEDCRDNELGYMFYHNLGGSFGSDLTGTQGLFTNIQDFHWSGTEFTGDPEDAWVLFFVNGGQGTNRSLNGGQGSDRSLDGGAWAVREGDVTVVPLPGGVWLLASGLLGLAGLRRDRR